MSKYIVSLENGRKFEFTAQAGLSQNEAVALLGNYLQQTEEAKEANTGFFTNLGSTLAQTDERAAAGISALMKGAGGDNAATQWLDNYVADEDARNRREGTGVYIPPEHRPPGFDEMVESWTNPNVGVMDAIGTSYDVISSGTGRVVGGFAPAVAAGALAPAGLPTLAASGLALAATQHLPEQTAAQDAKHQENIAAGLAAEGSETPYDLTALLGASAVNTALDMFVLGKSVPFLGKLLGMGGKKLQSEAAQFAAEQGITGAALKGLLKSEAYEVPTEVLQGVVNRAAAGQDLSSPEAIAEMIETAKDVAISTPVLGAVGGVSSRASAQREVEANQRLKEQQARELGALEADKQAQAEQVWVEEQQKDMTTAQKLEWEKNYHPEGTLKQKLSAGRIGKLQDEEKAETKKVKAEAQAAEKKWQEEFEGKEFADQIAAIDAKVDAGATESELKKWANWIDKADVDAESNAALRPLSDKVAAQLEVLAEEETKAEPTPAAHVKLKTVRADPWGTKLVKQKKAYENLIAGERTDENIIAIDEHLTNYARKNDAVLRQYPNVADIHEKADAIRAAQGKGQEQTHAERMAETVKPPVTPPTEQGQDTPATPATPATPIVETTDETTDETTVLTLSNALVIHKNLSTRLRNMTLEFDDELAGIKGANDKETKNLRRTREKEQGKEVQHLRDKQDNLIKHITTLRGASKSYEAPFLSRITPELKKELFEDPEVGLATVLELAPTAPKGQRAEVDSLISKLRDAKAKAEAKDNESTEIIKPVDTPADHVEDFAKEGSTPVTDKELGIFFKSDAVADEVTKTRDHLEKAQAHLEQVRSETPDWKKDGNTYVLGRGTASEITISKKGGAFVRSDYPEGKTFGSVDDAKQGAKSSRIRIAEDIVNAAETAAGDAEIKRVDPYRAKGGMPQTNYASAEGNVVKGRNPQIYNRDLESINTIAPTLTKEDVGDDVITSLQRIKKAVLTHWFVPTGAGFTVEDLASLDESLADMKKVATGILRVNRRRYVANEEAANRRNATPEDKQRAGSKDNLTKAEKIVAAKQLAAIVDGFTFDENAVLERATVAKTPAKQGAVVVKPRTKEQAQQDKEQVEDPVDDESTTFTEDEEQIISAMEEKLGLKRRVTGDKVGPGFTGVEAKKIVDSFARKKRLHKLNIQVVDTAENLPDNVKADIAGDLAGIHGAYKDDVIYVVADSHSSPAQVMETVAHEAMGHAGFARMFQKDYDRSVTSLFRQLGGVIGIEKLAADLGVAEGLAPYVAEYKTAMQGTDQAVNKEAERMLTEELLAVAQGKEAVASLPTRIWNALKAHVRRMVNWMKSKGFSDIEQLDTTDVHNILREMRAHSANTTLDTVTDKAALASREGPVDIDNFQTPTNFKTDRKAAQKQIKTYEKLAKEDFDARVRERVEGEAVGRALNAEDNVYSDLGTSQGLVKDAVANKKVFDRWLDRWITLGLDYNIGASEDLRRSYEEEMRNADWSGSKDLIGHMLRISNSQTVHDSAIGLQVLENGGAYYETDKEGFQFKWVAKDKDENGNKLATWLDLSDIIDMAAANHAKRGEKKVDTRGRMEGLFTEYTTALRLRALHERNEELKEHLNALNEPDVSTKAERDEAEARLGTKSKAASLAFKNKKGVWEFKPDILKKIHWIDKDKNVDTARIEGTIAQLSEAVPEVQEFVTTWEQLRNNVLDVMVEGGLYSRRQAETMMEKDSYVPFYRTTQMLAGQGPAEFTDGLMVEADKSLKGSMSEVGNVMDNIETWVVHEVGRAVRNKSATQLAKNAVSQGLGIELSKGEGNDVPNAVYAYINGQKTYFQLRDANYVNAFSGIEGTMSQSYNWANGFTSALRKNIVLNPLFAIGQLTQDAFSAMLTSNLPFHQTIKIPLKTITEFVKTLSDSSKVHDELKKLGTVGARDWSAAAIRGDAESHAHMAKDKKWYSGALRRLENFSMASDNAVRQAVYSVATEAGIDKREAVEKAFELINFRKHGASAKIQLMVRFVPFLGAALQSHHVLYKVMTSAGISPGDRVAAQKQLLTNMTMIMSLSTTLAMLHGDDEDYANANATTRSRSIYLGNDFWLPMRQDFFTWLAKSLPEELYLNYTESANVDTSSMRDTLSDSLITAILFPATPQFMKPILEVGFNKNLFTGRDIESQSMKEWATEDKWTTSTSPIARVISQTGAGVIGDAMFSPVQIDHFVRGYFGLTGASIMLGSRELAKNPGFVESARAMGADLNVIPDVASDDWLLKLPGNQWWGKGKKGNRLKTLMYDLLQKNHEGNERLRKLGDTYRQRDMTDSDVQDSYYAERADIIESYKGLLGKRYNNIRKSLNNIRARQTNIHKSDWSPKKKERMYNSINTTLNELLKRVDVMDLRSDGRLDEWK